MEIAIASDHGGLDLKQRVLDFLKSRDVAYRDLGTSTAESVDYPDYAAKVAKLVSEGQVSAGILLCGTGVGMCIAANKFKGVRAAVVSESYSARMAKEHNNANILCLGARVLTKEGAEKVETILAAWLDASYAGDRHTRRLDKIHEIENKNFKA